MSRKLASIEKITKVEPIEGADRIELVSILGWHCIVKKGDFKINDLVVYCEYDTILPVRNEFEFLRECCYSKKYDGFRIKNRKLRGVFSEGIVFPLSILDDIENPVIIKEGLDVSKILDIQRYDVDSLIEVDHPTKRKLPKNKYFQYFMRYKWFRSLVLPKHIEKGFPKGVRKTDEENIQVKFDALKEKGYEYYKTEKLEGQSATYSIIKNKFSVFSHNVKKGEDNSNWWKIAIKYNIEKKMKDIMKEFKIKNLAIQGEIIGPGIQKNVYKLNELKFYIFSITLLNNKRDCNLEEMLSFCKYTGLKMVPLLADNVQLLDSSDEILKDAEGRSKLYDTEREGVVWRVKYVDNKISFKAKSKKYQTIHNF